MLNSIASALNRNDELPNIELAEKLIKSEDSIGIAEIASGLKMGKAIANDCIKVLYEIGQQKPELILPHAEGFLDLLKSKNNRLVWGAMTALGQITPLYPDKVFKRFDDLCVAYNEGSVITIDSSMTVFANLCRVCKEYEQKILPVLFKHFETCRAKEIPQHFERIAVGITPDSIEMFRIIINKRFEEMTKSQQVRVGKVFKSLLKGEKR